MFIFAVFTCFPDLKKLGVKAFGSEFGAKLFQILDPENGVETSRENRIEPAKEISVEESAGSFSSGRVSQFVVYQEVSFGNLLQNRDAKLHCTCCCGKAAE